LLAGFDKTIIELSMNNIAIINGINLSNHAFARLFKEKNPLQMVCDFSKTLPDVKKIVLLLSGEPVKAEGIESVTGDFRTIKELLSKMAKESEGYENIFYFYGDCPFLDSSLAKKMFENHVKYMADYTFADGYPYGLTPEIIKSDIAGRLISLLKEEEIEITRQSIFEIIKKDINSFDIETELAPADQRLLRVQLCADTKRNTLLLKRIAEAGCTDPASICSLLDEKPAILRTLPSYFSIQITEQCPQTCTYCPYPLFGGKILEKKGEMAPEQFRLILDKISEFSDDAVINISVWGEPGLHSRIGEIAGSVCTNKKFSLIIETSGIGFKQEILTRLSSLDNKPDWIVSLDAWTNTIYEKLRGNGFSEAYKTAELLLELSKDHVYFQAVRMKENEDDLEHFYLNWQKKTEKVIIQKYDNFCSMLPDRKVTDLSPLKRFPCWHLKRDMVILLDGTVPLCREDVSKGTVLGNIFTDEISGIWEKGNEYYLDHIMEKYPELCRKCDEYYTFNF
jgi:spiro-SPASM protein